MQESFSMVLVIVNLRLLALAVAQDNKTCQYIRYYNAGYCSYPPHCSSLVRKTVAGGIRSWNSSNMVGLLFSWGDQKFQEEMVCPDQYSENFGLQDQFVH